MKLAALFSGGKDSTYSIYKVKQMGHDVKCLVTIFPKSSNSHLLHFPTIELTKLQSKTLKIPQIVSTLDSDELAEEMNVLKVLLEKAKRDFQIEGLVHGGISSEFQRSEEHTSELQSRRNLVCRLLLEKKKKKDKNRSEEHT